MRMSCNAEVYFPRTAAPIQHLFAWRIQQFTRSWPLFGLLSVLSIGSAGLGIFTAIGSLKHHQYVIKRILSGLFWLNGIDPHRLASTRTFIPTTDSWLALAMTCDFILA